MVVPPAITYLINIYRVYKMHDLPMRNFEIDICNEKMRKQVTLKLTSYLKVGDF